MMSRRELLRITILGTLVILGGCGEPSQKEIRAQKRQRRAEKEAAVERRKLLKKIRDGYEGAISPSQARSRNRFD